MSYTDQQEKSANAAEYPQKHEQLVKAFDQHQISNSDHQLPKKAYLASKMQINLWKHN